MFQIARPLFFICETPLHAGAGGGIGTELPIQREEHTQFPKVEASGIKGALREVFERKSAKKGLDDGLLAIFGHPTEGDKNAGALGLTDGRLLLFPVRSRQGIFAWTTCPRVLTRFARDLRISKANKGGTAVENLLAQVEAVLKESVSTTSKNSIADTNGNVFLEEYSIQIPANEKTDTLANTLAHEDLLNIPELPGQFVIIPDEYFSDFVHHCTEIHTRIRIGDNGVVEDGALFTEEHLPAESVLYGLAMAHPEFKKDGMDAPKIMDYFEKNLPEIVQIGGNATLGKGIVRITKKLLNNDN